MIVRMRSLNLSKKFIGSRKNELLKGFVIAMVAASSILTANEAAAVPGLSSSESVKKIVDMIKVYAKTNQAVNAYDLENQLRDRPRAASDALVDLLDTNDAKVQIEAARVLQRLSSHRDYSISSESLKTVMAILKATENPTVRSSLLVVLGNIGPQNEKVKQSILETINGDFEMATKRTAIEALAKLAVQEKPQFHMQSTEVLIKILKSDQTPALRVAAAQALSKYHSDANIAVPALVGALEDNFLTVRIAAVQSLGYYKNSAIQAIPQIIKLLDSESDNGIRSSCLFALRNIALYDKRVIAKYIELIDDSSVSRSVVSYLYNFGDRAAPAVPKLIVLLKGSDRYQRQSACRALGAIGDKAKDALPALKEAANDSDRSISQYAQSAINKIENKTSTAGRM